MATDKQKKAFKEMVENGGYKKDVMKNAGYSNAIVNNPKKVTESKGWDELLEEYLPDDLITKRHKWLINHKDTHAVKSGVDMAYKLKDRYASTKSDVNVSGGLDLITLLRKADKEE